MRRSVLAAVAAVALASPFLASSASASAAGAAADGQAQASAVRVCPVPAAGYAGCHALRNDSANPNGRPKSSTPSGYGPTDIEKAYALPAPPTAVAATAPVVAIVDAYDDPTAAQDLATYRSYFHLPSCDLSTGCFTKLNQTGGTTTPATNGGWAQEISLDLDMVSAACPSCRILLVEANSASFADLAAAVAQAQTQGAIAISNSYGGSDLANIQEYETAALAGIAVTASTGDNGYGVEAPASFSHVVAVGGTSLKRASTTSRGWTESAWSGAGSGCSTLNGNPGWQTSTQCPGKANADVSAVADPNTGVAVYDSTSYQGRSGWMVFGGTSASSPIIASVYALAGDSSKSALAGSLPWSRQSSLNDVQSGSNGSCSPAIWCTAGQGWDGPTGLGTPNGTTAF